MLVMSPNTERVYRGALAAAGLLDGPVDAPPSLAELRAAVVTHHLTHDDLGDAYRSARSA